MYIGPNLVIVPDIVPVVTQYTTEHQCFKVAASLASSTGRTLRDAARTAIDTRRSVRSTLSKGRS